MFNNDFYPTPPEVIDLMLAPYVDEYRGRKYFPCYQVLEPSAGKGDILDRLVNTYNVDKKKLFAIEADPELQATLVGKDYRLLDTDFLAFIEPYAFDFFLMNPPFDRGAEHLLHAWNMLKNGVIVCLLNAETLRNPYTAERQLLARIIEKHGCVEYIGRVFADAERPTDVEVVIVRLNKKDETVNPFVGAQFEQDGKVTEDEFAANPLAHANILLALVAQYEGAVETLKQIHKLQSVFRFYTNGLEEQFDSRGDKKTPEQQGRDDQREAVEHDMSLNDKIAELKARFWKYIFDKTKLGKVTTSEFQRKFAETQQRTANLAFSEANIMMVLEMFFQNREQYLMDCIVAVFDKATSYHADNVVHTEGWKTNKSWMIAQKIIMPNGVSYDAKSDYWSNHWHWDFFHDIDKVLCFVSGKNYEQISTLYSVISHRCSALSFSHGRNDYAAPFYSTFFKVRFYKKGTVHLTFLDKEVWAAFNQAAARGKKWVGQGY